MAFSSHDEVGDDLRRRWDDPDITFVDATHPVVYAGAGSHSGAYLPGEYVISVGLPLPGPVERLRAALLRILPWGDASSPAIGIPYIDYRRGDGPGVGPGEDRVWTPVLIDDTTDWVADYRGLWGLDTRDPLGGERAPAGPRYDRDGTVRDSWRHPVAWAGLDKEPATAGEAAEDLQALRDSLEGERERSATELAQARTRLRGAQVADRADGRDVRHPSARVSGLAREVEQLRGRDASLATDLEAVDRAIAAAPAADGVHAHLRHRALPIERTDRQGLRERLLRVWAAASASLLLAAAGVLLLTGYPDLVGAMLVLVAVSVTIEAVLRGRFAQLLVNVAVAAIVLVGIWAVVAIVLGNFRQGVGVLLLLAAAYMGWQTFREGSRT